VRKIHNNSNSVPANNSPVPKIFLMRDSSGVTPLEGLDISLSYKLSRWLNALLDAKFVVGSIGEGLP